MTSPITGGQVIVCYYPVFDESGQGIGYVGIAVKADGLVKVLDSLEFIGLEHASYYLLDVAQSLYVFEIIAASVRNPIHVTDCALAGADIATIPYNVIETMMKHPLTDQGIEKFQADYKKVFGE